MTISPRPWNVKLMEHCEIFMSSILAAWGWSVFGFINTGTKFWYQDKHLLRPWVDEEWSTLLKCQGIVDLKRLIGTAALRMHPASSYQKACCERLQWTSRMGLWSCFHRRKSDGTHTSGFSFLGKLPSFPWISSHWVVSPSALLYVVSLPWAAICRQLLKLWQLYLLSQNLCF